MSDRKPPEFRLALEQAYWERRLAILKSPASSEQARSELMLLESFRTWIAQGRAFNHEAARTMLARMQQKKEKS